MDVVRVGSFFGVGGWNANVVHDPSVLAATQAVAREVSRTREAVIEVSQQQTAALSTALQQQTSTLLDGLDTLHSDFTRVSDTLDQSLFVKRRMLEVQRTSLEVQHKTLEALQNPGATRANELFSMARRYMTGGLFKESSELLEDAAKLDPTNRPVLITLYTLTDDEDKGYSYLLKALTISENWEQRSEVVSDACAVLFDREELNDLLKKADAEFALLVSRPKYHAPSSNVLLHIARMYWQRGAEEFARLNALEGLLQGVESLGSSPAILRDEQFGDWLRSTVIPTFIQETLKRIDLQAAKIDSTLQHLQKLGLTMRELPGIQHVVATREAFMEHGVDPVYLQATLRLDESTDEFLSALLQQIEEQLERTVERIRARSWVSPLACWEDVSGWIEHYVKFPAIVYHVLGDVIGERVNKELLYYSTRLAAIGLNRCEQVAPFAELRDYTDLHQQEYQLAFEQLSKLLWKPTVVGLRDVESKEEELFTRSLAFINAAFITLTTRLSGEHKPKSGCMTMLLLVWLGLLLLALFIVLASV